MQKLFLNFLSTIAVCCAVQSVAAQTLPYQNPSLSARERARPVPASDAGRESPVDA